jgi:hypothetical protein
MITDAGLINDLLNARDIPIFFTHALHLHVNELDSPNFLQGTYLEFLEAFARICEQASIPSEYDED